MADSHRERRRHFDRPELIPTFYARARPRQDSHRQESYRQQTYREEFPREDFTREDFRRQESQRQESQRQESQRQDSHRQEAREQEFQNWDEHLRSVPYDILPSQPYSSPFARIPVAISGQHVSITIVNLIQNIGPPRYRDPYTRRFDPVLGPVTGKVQPGGSKQINLIFYRIAKGKIILIPDWKSEYKESWTDKDFVTELNMYYQQSHHWWARGFTKIKYIYFITMSQSLYDDVVHIQYDEILPYKGPRTISRLLYLLENAKHKKSWIKGLHQLASDVKRSPQTQPYIMIEIIETLNTSTVLFLSLCAIVLGLLVGIAYGLATHDWGTAFTLSSLAIACLALVLALLSVYQYLGLEKIIDDEVNDALTGDYNAHYTKSILHTYAPTSEHIQK